MTHPKRLYWIVTCLMAAFMLMASIPDILRIPQAVEVFTHLGYPSYLLPFIGIAKTLGVVAVLAPGFHRLKEWAYAGLVFDLIGALYSHLAVGDPPSAWGGASVGLILVAGSYLLFRRRLTDEGTRRLQSSSAIYAGFLAGITALTIATPLLARGQAQTVPQSAERMQHAGPEVAHLKQRVGTWDVTARLRLAPDAAPIVTEGLRAERAMVGLYLQEVIKPAPESNAPEFQRLAYDSARIVRHRPVSTSSRA